MRKVFFGTLRPAEFEVRAISTEYYDITLTNNTSNLNDLIRLIICYNSI